MDNTTTVALLLPVMVSAVSASKRKMNFMNLVMPASIAAMVGAMHAINSPYKTFTAVKPNPTGVTMEAAADALKATDCDVVIGFSGGSAIDTAKSAALLRTNPGRIGDATGAAFIAVKNL